MASLTICLVQGEAQLVLEKGITAVAHLVQLFPPASSVLVAAVSQRNLTTLLNDDWNRTKTWLPPGWGGATEALSPLLSPCPTRALLLCQGTNLNVGHRLPKIRKL